MDTILQTEIEGKEAKLVLLSDRKTIQVIYDGEVIASTAGNTWSNYQGEEWAQKLLVEFEVRNYARKNTADKEFEEAMKLLE